MMESIPNYSRNSVSGKVNIDFFRYNLFECTATNLRSGTEQDLIWASYRLLSSNKIEKHEAISEDFQ